MRPKATRREFLATASTAIASALLVPLVGAGQAQASVAAAAGATPNDSNAGYEALVGVL